jgi:hypothetical protein
LRENLDVKLKVLQEVAKVIDLVGCKNHEDMLDEVKIRW